MDTKPLLYGLIGFFLGGLLVAIAANTFDKDKLQDTGSRHGQSLNRTTSD